MSAGFVVLVLFFLLCFSIEIFVVLSLLRFFLFFLQVSCFVLLFLVVFVVRMIFLV